MPSSLVLDKFRGGRLHSGSKKGPLVKNRKQAIAIMLSEKENEKEHGGTYLDRESQPQRLAKPKRKRG